MISTVLIVAGVAGLAGLLAFVARRGSRGRGTRHLELGSVSTSWLSELRRDEPWTSNR